MGGLRQVGSLGAGAHQHGARAGARHALQVDGGMTATPRFGASIDQFTVALAGSGRTTMTCESVGRRRTLKAAVRSRWSERTSAGPGASGHPGPPVGRR
jgi:hypothetical protein